MKISIVTVCFQRWDFLRKSLPSWHGLPDVSGIFVAGYASDPAPDWLDDVSLVSIPDSHFHKTRAMNCAADAARRIDNPDYLLVMDADIIISDPRVFAGTLQSQPLPDYVLASRNAIPDLLHATVANVDLAKEFDGKSGTHLVRAELFFRLCGFDQRFIGWGYHDPNLYSRYWRLSKNVAIYDRTLLKHQPHSGKLRAQNNPGGESIEESENRHQVIHTTAPDLFGDSWKADFGYANATITRLASRRDESADSLYQQAVRHFQTGQLQQADELCFRLLQRWPEHAAGWSLFGAICQRQQRWDEAEANFTRALALEPVNPAFHNNLGEVHRSQGHLAEAVACYQNALRSQPTYHAAHNNLGLALQAQGKLADAESSFRQALVLQPNYAKGHFNLGNVLREQRRLDDSVTSLREALRLQPNYPEALTALGVVLDEQGHLEESVATLREALRLRPDYPKAHLNLGNVLAKQAQSSDAETHFRRALALQANYFEALLGLAVVLQEKREMREAAECLHRAIRLRPDSAAAHYNLGNVFFTVRQFERAVTAYQRALALEPDFAEARMNLVCCRGELCDWQNWDADIESLRKLTAQRLAEGRPSPLTASYFPCFPLTSAEQLAIARRTSELWDARVSRSRSRQTSEFSNRMTSATTRPIRLGYLSRDFRNHAVAHLTRSMFRYHDRSQFEVWAYSYGPDDGSDYRREIAQSCDHFIDVADRSAAEIAQRIQADGIDILLDLVGYTGHALPEIVARRPAPIQVNYLGFPGTMGASFMDYYITDAVATPERLRESFSEQLVFMPHSYQVNDHEQPIAEKSFERGECGLPERGFVFCCFNRHFKIQPAIFDVWMRILSQTPGSVLWLIAGESASQNNLRREAEARGVAAERLVFAEPLPKPLHLARHKLADLFLDTPIYNAHTTASDSLWAGVPVLTCPGETFAARVGASLLSAAGLPELIAASFEEYEHRAIDFAHQPHTLLTLRTKLATQRMTCRLFDTPGYVRHFEQALRSMWQHHTTGTPPCSIVVSDPLV